MRVRFRYTKLGKVRFTSHRDVARLLERALRRAQLPVANTEGFSPRPKMHFGLALPTGGESLAEYLDIDFREPDDGGDHAPAAPVDIDALPGILTPLLPIGLDIDVVAIVDRKAPSLQEAVVACTWRLGLDGAPASALRSGVDQLLAADTLPVSRERKGKVVTDDIRPNIEGLAVDPDGELVADLATQPRGVRPAELVAALSGFTGTAALDAVRVCRTHQWIVLDGARREPLPPSATRAPHAEARAS
jgi:radical SAM-linked protein